MRRARTALLLALALSCLRSLAGCTPGGPVAPPDPPTGLTLAWVEFDTILAVWNPPASPVDHLVAEGRMESGPWEVVEGAIPPDAIGGYVFLEHATPELITLGVRMYSVRSGIPSPYTPEVSLFRGLRPPQGLLVRTREEDVALSWIPVSTAAVSVRIERMSDGPFETVAVLPASTTSWLDSTTLAPGLSYAYRLTHLATYRGAEVASETVVRSADQPTSLSPPVNVQAAVQSGNVQLTWTPTSRNGQVQRVERTPTVFGGSPVIVGELEPTATTFIDPAPEAGTYAYRILVGMLSPPEGWSPSDPVTVLVPPAPGAWGIEAETLRVPYGDGTARGEDGSWWFANHWTTGAPWLPRAGAIWAPADGSWARYAFPGSETAEYVIEPGILLGPQGEPHVLWLLNLDPTTSAPPQELHHAWMTGGAWNDERVVEKIFWNDNLGYLAQFALDGAGKVHVAWTAISISGGVQQVLHEYASSAGGSWSVEPIPLTLVQGDLVERPQLAAAPDGTVHVVVIGATPFPSSIEVAHLRRLPDGTWTEELVPTGPHASLGSARIVARGPDELDLLFTDQAELLGSWRCRFQARTGAGWGAPETLAGCDPSSGNPLPALATTPGGERRAALLELPDGLGLATWDVGGGWTVERIGPTATPEVPWLGFDSGGVMHALVPGVRPGDDGYEQRVRLRSTR